ncbi:MAG TPA: hypothetical protein ENI33_08825 [Thermoplasmatales archaeon]|nr:hypothetical protein [Thermoplasmatales archaeon]
MKIVISKKDGDEKEFYEMDIGNLIYTKIIDSKEEIDNLQWGEIINVLKNIKRMNKEKNPEKYKKIVECAKNLEKAIHTHLDLDLRHSMAHGKIKVIKEEEDIIMKYIKGGKEQKLNLKEFLQRYNKMREFSFILIASLVVGITKYLFQGGE